MIELVGKKIGNGIAIGRIRYYNKEETRILRRKIQDTSKEIERYESASKETERQLESLYEKALLQVGEANAEIFHIHAMMLQDADYRESICNMIRTQEVNAEYAAAVTGDHFADAFSGMEDEYFRARSADIRDVTERLIRTLLGGEKEENLPSDLREKPVILAAEDLTPSETVQMDKSSLLGFVTRQGSSNSHTAILARTMGIPALAGVEVEPSWDGKMAVLDGNQGKILIAPDPSVLEKYQAKQAEEQEKKKLLKNLKGKETVTKSGKKVKLYANIGNVGDLGLVMENDGEGIGLFRSEFLYLEASDYPSEEEQFQSYKMAVETMGGKQVIIRTLDIGADKQVDYFGLEKEENPAMGCRAIRICLTRPDIFRTQLRALFRASAYGNLSILYPMIISEEEVRQIREISSQVKEELRMEGIPVGHVQEGIMIETPAAALISDRLAPLVDFFSIGTNDLTQYTLAADRQNPQLEAFYRADHEAVIRLIRMTVENAHRAGIWVGICGELAGELSLTETFLDMGVDELSVSPSKILPLREKIRSLL